MPADFLMRHEVGHVVYSHLRKAIECGDLQPGQLVASARQLQGSLGVSHHAVVQGMARLAREGWVMRRSGRGTFVQDARSRRMAAFPRTIALVTGEHLSGRYFLNPLLDAVNRDLAAGGHAIRHQTHADDASAVPPPGIKADCAIWVKSSIPPRLTLPAGVPFVIACHLFNAIVLSETPCDIVTIDQTQGGVVAGRYLRESGCRQVLFVGVAGSGPGGWDTVSGLRLRGFEAAWGAPLPPENLLRVNIYTPVCGLEIAREIFSRNGSAVARPSGERPLGIFAASDDLAMGLAHGAVAHGVTLGGDVRLMGFDGQRARFPEDPLLTTVDIPLAEMGRIAVRLALERAAAPDRLPRRVSMGCLLRKGQTA